MHEVQTDPAIDTARPAPAVDQTGRNKARQWHQQEKQEHGKGYIMILKALMTAGIGAAALMTAPAMAQDRTSQDWAQRQAAQNEIVSAERMMSGDVTNGFNMLGNVSDLVLNERGTGVEYILYEVPFPYSTYSADDGFVRWDNIEVERGVGTGLDLQLDDDASPYAKEQLRLTRAQASNRLVSRIVGSDITFADGQMREIEDIQFDPQSGMITNFVIEMDENSLFNEDTRLIPASMVTLDPRGMWMVSQPVTYNWTVWVM